MRISALALSLAALAIPASASAPVVEPPRITITVDSFSISPQQIRLPANQAVTMVFVNKSGSSHDFSAPEFFARAQIRGGNVTKGKIDLPPHATRAILLQPAPGTYKAWCGHFMHTTFGMRAQILVS